MISEYKFEQNGQSVLMRVDSGDIWIDQGKLIMCLAEIVDISEQCKQFSLAIIKTETPND